MTTEVSAIVAELTSRDPAPPIRPKGPWKPELTAVISGLPVRDEIKAGLHLFNDDLTEAHEITQKGAKKCNRDLNYWHAIVHRRDGDFSNSKYWYREVGAHPVLTGLKQYDPGWDPLDFVDRCEQAPSDSSLIRGQLTEMSALLAFVQEETE